MLHLEPAAPPVVLETVRLHFDYIGKVITMSDDRLPKVVLKSVIRKRASFIQEWDRLASDCGETIRITPGGHFFFFY